MVTLGPRLRDYLGRQRGRGARPPTGAFWDFDVVFSDVAMPGMTGVEFGYEVRRLSPGLQVVLSSG